MKVDERAAHGLERHSVCPEEEALEARDVEVVESAAWAVDERNAPLYPVGRGFSGERQRELARRFGVNLLMHVLTGNYKSDQVHVPALLDRLGQ